MKSQEKKIPFKKFCPVEIRRMNGKHENGIFIKRTRGSRGPGVRCITQSGKIDVFPSGTVVPLGPPSIATLKAVNS